MQVCELVGRPRLRIRKGWREGIAEMNKVIPRVVRHEGGWALEANGIYSKGFRTREAARQAAKLAAGEHTATRPLPVSSGKVAWQDDSG
jgi:hypothetical protein